VATLITKVLFKQVLIRAAAQQVENEVFFADDKYISGARSAIVSMEYTWVHQQ